MKRNMGIADKFIRMVIAFVIPVLYYNNIINGTLAIVLGVFAVIFVVTSFISFCPLYAPLGINTCKSKMK